MTEADSISRPARRACAVAAALLAIGLVVIAAIAFRQHGHGEPLRVGFNEFRPYAYITPDGKPAGLAVDVVKEAARRSGQTLVWLPVDDGEKALRNGTIDVYPLLTVTADRLNRFHFSDYWWQDTLELVSSRRRPVSGAANASGKRIGIRMKAFVVNLARSLLPGANLVGKPDVDSLVNALCSGEIDALFSDVGNVERRLVDRPSGCQSLGLKIAVVPGATLPLGTVSTRRARNRADLLFTRIDDLVADGTLANLASTYQLATPVSNAQLAQLLQGRKRDLFLEAACLALACLLVTFVIIGVRMRVARRTLEETHLKLEESEQRFHAFMDHLAANAFMKDSTGRIVYANKADAEMLNMRPHEYLGKTNFELLPRSVAEQLHANDQIVLQSNCARQFTESIPDHTGTIRHWLTFKFPIRSRSGETFLGGVSIEITEMMHAQNALRESESRYRQIVEVAGDIITRCDLHGRVTYVNEMGERILKYSAGALQGQKALALVRPGDRKRVIGELRRQLTAGQTDLYIEVPVITGDGSELSLGQTIRVLRAGDVFTGFQAISRDITECRRMEAELRSSEERFRLLYENGPVAYHEIDRHGVIRHVNRAECEMLGYSASQLVGRSVLDLVVPEDREIARAAIDAKVHEKLALHPFHRTYLRPDGRRVRLEIHENLRRDETGRVIGIHSVLVDVTQRHLAEMLDRDRRKVSEMIAQQQPLDRILGSISLMINHQDEALRCIPLRLVREDEGHRLQPACAGDCSETLALAVRDLARDAFSLWPSGVFRVNHSLIPELAAKPASARVAAAATLMGVQSCWSIPILSSSQSPLGMLLVFSPRAAEPTVQEKRLLEAGGRLAAIAIEHRYMTDLLNFQASHDGLTRLPNRSTFETRLEEAIARARAHYEVLAVLYVDLDRFKEVNDTFGHSGGDELLRQVAVRLRGCIRHTDLLARIGGDEFSLLLPGLCETAEANRVAEAILDAFHLPFDIAGARVSVTSSIGISFYPKDGLDATTLQRNSDSAMYRVKNAGKNSFRCFTPESRTRAERKAPPVSVH